MSKNLKVKVRYQKKFRYKKVLLLELRLKNPSGASDAKTTFFKVVEGSPSLKGGEEVTRHLLYYKPFFFNVAI